MVEKFHTGIYGQYTLMIYDKTNEKVIDFQYHKLWFYIDAINRKDKVSTQKMLLLTDLNDSKKFDDKNLPTNILKAIFQLNIQPLTDKALSIGMIKHKKGVLESCTVTKKITPFDFDDEL